MGIGQLAGAITDFPADSQHSNNVFKEYSQVVFSLSNQAGLLTIARVTIIMCEFWEDKKERLHIEHYGMIEKDTTAKFESLIHNRFGITKRFKYKFFH